jgi:hypothetical protein
MTEVQKDKVTEGLNDRKDKKQYPPPPIFDLGGIISVMLTSNADLKQSR